MPLHNIDRTKSYSCLALLSWHAALQKCFVKPSSHFIWPKEDKSCRIISSHRLPFWICADWNKCYLAKQFIHILTFWIYMLVLSSRMPNTFPGNIWIKNQNKNKNRWKMSNKRRWHFLVKSRVSSESMIRGTT